MILDLSSLQNHNSKITNELAAPLYTIADRDLGLIVAVAVS